MKHYRQRLLVSIRGKKEALSAVKGGAHIADVEYPASALGTPYPLNIHMVRNALPKTIAVSTKIKIWGHYTSYYQLSSAFHLFEASEFPVKKITGMVSPDLIYENSSLNFLCHSEP